MRLTIIVFGKRARFTYAIDAMRIMIFGVNLSAVATGMFLMVGFGVVMLLVAIPICNRAMSK
jgi:hypothetical protein